MKNMYLAVVFSVAMVAQCIAGEVNVDILAGTINGKSINSISIDELTDMLGRPSDSWEAYGQKTIIYADKGLRFSFNNDGKKFMTVFLVAYADGSGSFSVNYSAYKGKLSKGLNSDWKIKKFMEEFREFKLVKESDIVPDCITAITKGQRPFCKLNWIVTLSS